MLELGPEAARGEVLVFEQVGGRVDDAPTVADLLRLGDQLRAGEALAEFGEHLDQVIGVLAAGRDQHALRGVELGQPLLRVQVFGHSVVVKPFDGLARGQTKESAERERGDVAVGGLEDVLPAPVAADVAPVAGAGDVDAANIPGGIRVVVGEGDRLLHRLIDVLAAPGSGAVVVRDHRADDRLRGSLGVALRGGGSDWRAAGRAAERGEAAHRRADQIRRPPVRVGAVLPEGGDRGHHQPRIAGADRLPAQADRSQRAGRRRFDDEVGLIDEFEEELAPARLAQIERRAALGVVECPPEERAFGVRFVVVEGRAPARAGGLAGRLELDHVGAQLGEHAPGQHAEFVGQVEHAEGRKRPAWSVVGHRQSRSPLRAC